MINSMIDFVYNSLLENYKIFPFESTDYRKASTDSFNAFKKFAADLSEERKKEMRELIDGDAQAYNIGLHDYFCAGFRVAVKLMSESISENDSEPLTKG